MIPRPYDSIGGNVRDMPVEYLKLLADQVAWQHLANEVVFATIDFGAIRKCGDHIHEVAWCHPQGTFALTAVGDTRLHTAN